MSKTEPDEMWIVLVGNIIEGYTAHGPFPTWEEASGWISETEPDYSGYNEPQPCILSLEQVDSPDEDS